MKLLEALGLMRPDKAKIHIKVETGLNRQGIALKDLPQFLKLVKVHKNIEIVGIFLILPTAIIRINKIAIGKIQKSNKNMQ